MKRVFVDTSAWYAFARRDDPHHAEAAKAMKHWQGRLVTSDFIFDETVTLLRARAGHGAAVRVGEALFDPGIVEMVEILPDDIEDAWSHFVGHKDKAYSFTDCTSFAVMRRLRIPIALATDRHFKQAGFQVEPD